jgi:pimeloyl-ACP methyl ester carboxylesterase
VLSLPPRPGTPYQVAAADLLGVLDQFGFLEAMLLAEGVSCAPAVLVAAWHPSRLAGLVLVEPPFGDLPPSGEALEARALRDCPPDWSRLRAAIRCPVLSIDYATLARAGEIESFVASSYHGQGGA